MLAEKLEWKDVVSAWHTDESSDVSNVTVPQRYDKNFLESEEINAVMSWDIPAGCEITPLPFINTSLLSLN
jgi:hypothetical protein